MPFCFYLKFTKNSFQNDEKRINKDPLFIYEAHNSVKDVVGNITCCRKIAIKSKVILL